MPRHGACVAEAEVDVLVAVDIYQTGPARLGHVDRIRRGPLGHPAHRHAAEEHRLRALPELARAGMGTAEASLLFLQQRSQARTLDRRVPTGWRFPDLGCRLARGPDGHPGSLFCRPGAAVERVIRLRPGIVTTTTTSTCSGQPKGPACMP